MEIRERIQQMPHYREIDYPRLDANYGAAWVDRRLLRQWNLYHNFFHRPFSPLRRGYFHLFRFGVRAGLMMLGQWPRARRQAHSPEVVEHEILLPKLPASLDGIRILHLSDFHFDYNRDLAAIICQRLAELPFDLCVLTGDYRGETFGPFLDSLADLERVRDALGDEVYAVLGNHDCIEMAPQMNEMGIRLLVNEGVWLEREGGRMLIAGIDDPHFYQTHDFAPLQDMVQDAEVSLLLSHSPEIYREAEGEGFDLCWSGHTHGGQLCLPGGYPLLTHLHDTPRDMVAGPWRWKRLQGYTSRGIGTSGVAVRLHCAPEITVHTLTKGPG